MHKKTVLAVIAAAALLFGSVEASAGNEHGDHDGGGNHNSGSVQNHNNVHNNVHNNIHNTTVGVNKNYNNLSNYNATTNNNNNNNNNYNKNYNFNNNNNSNKNYNTNNNYNANTNNNTNTNNNNNKNTNTNNNNSNAAASAGALSNANSNSAGGDGGSSSVNISGDEAAASSAAPVYLTSSNDTCMGSSGVGGQGMSFGFSLGTTWTDSNCIMLKNARELKVQGHEKAAKARLCMDKDNAMAFELAGEPCPRALKSTQAAVAEIQELNQDRVTVSKQDAAPGSTQTAARSIVPVTAGIAEPIE